jgi:hypothetical protein
MARRLNQLGQRCVTIGSSQRPVCWGTRYPATDLLGSSSATRQTPAATSRVAVGRSYAAPRRSSCRRWCRPACRLICRGRHPRPNRFRESQIQPSCDDGTVQIAATQLLATFSRRSTKLSLRSRLLRPNSRRARAPRRTQPAKRVECGAPIPYFLRWSFARHAVTT